jgi:hypothetical protein
MEDSSNGALFKYLLQYGEILTAHNPHTRGESTTSELLARSLSDWHLLSCVGSLGLLSDVRTPFTWESTNLNDTLRKISRH